jgi:predicted alpha/beta-fold hydrolase
VSGLLLSRRCPDVPFTREVLPAHDGGSIALDWHAGPDVQVGIACAMQGMHRTWTDAGPCNSVHHHDCTATEQLPVKNVAIQDSKTTSSINLICSQALTPTAPILVLAAGLTGGSDARCVGL